MEKILFTTDRSDYEATINDMVASNTAELDIDEGVDYEMVDEFIQNDYAALLEDLNIQFSNSLVLIAKLRLWNGIKDGLKFIDSGNLADAIKEASNYDDITVRISDTDLIIEGTHHDGTNVIRIRELRSEMDRDRLENALYKNKNFDQAIIRYTRSIVPTVSGAIGE